MWTDRQTQAPVRGGRVTTSGQCRRWLSEHHEGRIHYQTGRGPRCLAVTYTVAGDFVMLRVPDYNELAQYAPGQRVALEVPEPDGTLTVTGTAESACSRHSDLVAEAQFPERWPDGVGTEVICFPIGDVSELPLATVDGRQAEHPA